MKLPEFVTRRRRLKIGIRPQLIIIVCFSSLSSLLILAIVTGIYFSKNLSGLRGEKLEVIAQLKASQVKQSIQFIYYQVVWLSQKDSISTPLSFYRAGNTSQDMFAEAQSTLDGFISTSQTFAMARLYNLDLQVVAATLNNNFNISSAVGEALFPLLVNTTIPTSVTFTNDSNALNTGFMSGPLRNTTDLNSMYFLGITIPIYSNLSIIITRPTVSGYLTVLSSAQNVQMAVNTTSKDYDSLALRPIYQNVSVAGDPDYLMGFESIFPNDNNPLVPNTLYPINSSSAASMALTDVRGLDQNAAQIDGPNLAIAFDRVPIDAVSFWSIVIEQKRSTFLAPVKKLTDIMIGVVIGTGALMCLITFGLAVWFIKPITKLKEATEAITRLKREKDFQAGLRSNTSLNSPSREENSSEKRDSVHTISSSGSNGYSSGIRLPGKIPKSKKLFKDELTELSDAFNIMTEELEKQYTHLEDRVKQRTKELEASKIEAEAANEAKTVFIANISHELRTPLNGILGMTSIAMEETDQLQIQDSLKLIHRSGELLLHIFTELLTYSKNTLNRSKLEKSNFQILEIAHQVKSIFGKVAIDQRVNFKILIKPNIFRKLILFGDSNRIIQIVMNLVSNSLKFTPVDGSVDVSFKLVGEYDYGESEAVEFNEVCVLKDAKIKSSSKNSSETTKADEYDKQAQLAYVSSKEGTANSESLDEKNENTHLFNSMSSTKSNDDCLMNDADTCSLATISTTEYENTLFHSQFTSTKPLPHIPRSRNASVANSDHNSPTEINVIPKITLQSECPPDPNQAYDANCENGVVANSSNPSSPGEQSSSSCGPNAQKPNNGFTRRTSHVSLKHLDSDVSFLTTELSNSELLKNNKVYRLRKLYHPKTWVIQIEVKDTGSGIEPALQEKVFEPFVQGDQTLSRSYGGTGLGLSICRQLAKMMNGTLTLKSTIGKGSTFLFTVPLPQNGEIVVSEHDLEEFSNDEFNPNSKMNRKVLFDIKDADEHVTERKPLAASTENSSPTKPAHLKSYSTIRSTSTLAVNLLPGDGCLDNLSHLNIMVAEDNSVNQEVIKRMLKLEGFSNITMAANGAEAVDLVKNSYNTLNFYDLIFMDVQMPKMDGLTATKIIRNNLQFKKPIIALTAFADESNVKECLNCGMSGFLSKPIKRANLRKIVTEFSPSLLSGTVTTPTTFSEEEKRLGF